MLMAVFILVGFPPPPVGPDSQERPYLLQLKACSFDSSVEAVEIPTRRGVCTAVGSLWLFCCFGTMLQRFHPRAVFPQLLRGQTEEEASRFADQEKAEGYMSPAPFLVLLLARPSRNARPLIHPSPPPKEFQRNQ